MRCVLRKLQKIFNIQQCGVGRSEPGARWIWQQIEKSVKPIKQGVDYGMLLCVCRERVG